MSRLLLTLLIGTGCSEYKIQSAAETDAGVERAPQILASPEQVSMGWVESGDAGVEVVQIANIGEADLNVTDLRLESALTWTITTAGADTVEAGGATTVILEWEATSDGDGSDALVISSNDPEQPVVSVPLSWEVEQEERPPGEQLDRRELGPAARVPLPLPRRGRQRHGRRRHGGGRR